MPIKQCQKEGKKGFKYGSEGHCYTGKSGKAKAVKQAVAIKIQRGEIKVKGKK